MIYVLTVANLAILCLVAGMFFAFRKAVDKSGVRQIDDYLHELEASVAQLTEQFERTSTKISKDLLRKTTEVQSLLGECDVKLAQLNKARALPVPAALTPAAEAPLAPAGNGQHRAEDPATAVADPANVGQQPVAAPGTPGAVIPAAQAARRMSASELLALKPAPMASTSQPSNGAKRPATAASEPPVIKEPAAASPDDLAGAAQEPRPTSGANQPNDKYRLIFLLSSEGMDPGSIARHTNLTRGEVEMLLDLRRQGKL